MYIQFCPKTISCIQEKKVEIVPLSHVFFFFYYRGQLKMEENVFKYITFYIILKIIFNMSYLLTNPTNSTKDSCG